MTQSWLEKLQSISTIPLKEKLFFIKNLTVMTKSGINLTSCLTTLAKQTNNRRFAKIIETIKVDTESGLPFHQAVGKHLGIFDPIFISMIEAGETSGKLQEVLEQIFLQLKKTHDLRNKIISALIYPSVVAGAMIIIGLAMMILVVPKITAIFAEQNADLPLITKIIIGFSNFLINYWYLDLLILIAIIIAVVMAKHSLLIKKIFQKISLYLPIFGPISKKINLSQFTRTFSSLLKTNIPVEKSLIITANTLRSYWYQTALKESAASIIKGSSLTNILKQYPALFPPLIIQMTAAGEESGSIDDLFLELAKFYEAEVDETMRTLPALLEPILILIIGAAVSLMAVGILMPMYTITQHL